MRKSFKISGIIGGVLILLILAVFITGYVLIRLSVPQTEGAVQVAGLQMPVEITYDKMGIPQIWAESGLDAYFSFGYLHASDRMFQMDMTRRVAQGRLSKLLGPTVLNIDIHQRTIGHYRIAQKFLDKLSPENRVKLQAYANGVNAYKNSCDALPFEFQLLQQDFTDWTIYDCLSIMSFQTWFSDYLMSPDAFLTEAVDKLGYEKIKSLNVPYPDWAPLCTPQPPSTSDNSTVSHSERSRGTTRVIDNPIRKIFAEQIFKDVDLPFRMSNSSNSWVIAPHRSASGRAIFASDPHLDVSSLPQFWYQAGVHIKETNTNVLGISTPGLPFITMGHNNHIAWAFTVSGVDVNEYYIEKINEQDSTEYLTAEGWKKLNVFPQEIKISGYDKPYTFDVLATGHGPLVFENDSLNQRYSLHWAGYDVNLDACFSSGFNLTYLDNFTDFRKAVTNFGALDANWTYADINGNIGYQLGTPIAVRPPKSDNFPVPGWTGTHEWQGFYPLDKTPHSYNPPRGWLASCNNKQDAANLDYELFGNYASDRILRIGQLLESKKVFTVQDMYDFQMDTKDAYLLRWKPILVELLIAAGETETAGSISSWDGSSDSQSAKAALVNLFLTRLHHLTFDDELGTKSAKLLKSDLDHIWHNGPFEWFDNINTKEVRETKEQIATQALSEALQIRAEKKWGDFHTLQMKHPLAVVPLVADLLKLDYGPFPWDGTAGTLKASFYFEDKKNPNHFISTVGPSWRFVIDFAKPDAATFVLPAGNSGNPASSHFMDFFNMWKSGERWNVPSSKPAVEKRTVHRLILEPGK